MDALHMIRAAAEFGHGPPGTEPAREEPPAPPELMAPPPPPLSESPEKQAAAPEPEEGTGEGERPA
jgi:hypothetical protein